MNKKDLGKCEVEKEININDEQLVNENQESNNILPETSNKVHSYQSKSILKFKKQISFIKNIQKYSVSKYIIEFILIKYIHKTEKNELEKIDEDAKKSIFFF